MKSLGFVAVIKAMVAGEMDPKYAVDLAVNRYQSPDSKRVLCTVGHGDPWSKPMVKMKGWGGDEKGKTGEEMERESVCISV